MVVWNANSENNQRNKFRSIKVNSEQFKTCNVQECKPSKIKAENNLSFELAQEDSVRVDLNEFRRLVGSLLYLVGQTNLQTQVLA